MNSRQLNLWQVNSWQVTTELVTSELMTTELVTTELVTTELVTRDKLTRDNWTFLQVNILQMSKVQLSKVQLSKRSDVQLSKTACSWKMKSLYLWSKHSVILQPSSIEMVGWLFMIYLKGFCIERHYRWSLFSIVTSKVISWFSSPSVYLRWLTRSFKEHSSVFKSRTSSD